MLQEPMMEKLTAMRLLGILLAVPVAVYSITRIGK